MIYQKVIFFIVAILVLNSLPSYLERPFVKDTLIGNLSFAEGKITKVDYNTSGGGIGGAYFLSFEYDLNSQKILLSNIQHSGLNSSFEVGKRVKIVFIKSN